MREIILNFDQVYPENMELGIVGENLATTLIIRCANVLGAFPGAFFSIKIRRSDGLMYPAAAGLAADTHGDVWYLVRAADVSVPGIVEMEVQATYQGAVVRSTRYTFEVKDALESGAPEEPEPDWMDDVIRAAADAVGAAQTAKEADQSASKSATSAESYRDETRALVEAFTTDEINRSLAEQGRVAADEERGALYREVKDAYESGRLKGEKGDQGDQGDKGDKGNVMYATFEMDAEGDLWMYTDEAYDGFDFAIDEDGVLEVILDA